MVLHRYTGFFVILPCIPSFAQCVALPFGPGHGCQWSTGRKSFIQDDGTINFNSTKVPFSLWCYEHGEDLQDGGWDRPLVMSPIQVQNGCHLCWPSPCGSLLVGPADQPWWYNLACGKIRKWNNGHLIPSCYAHFFKSENSIMYEGWNDCLVWCFPFLFNDVTFYLGMWFWSLSN